MKVTTAKHGLRSIVTAFFLFGALLFSASSANAQTYNWMTESEALTALDGAINLLALDQSNFTPGSTPWTNAENHIHYYKLVYAAINDGSSVPDAVDTTLMALNDEKTALADLYTKQVLGVLRADIVDLLTL
ncbi:MAG: hypothetical protein IPJ82_08585 [Lewinellaceae bacterium]|nr:hypothetical protein [Lewinellaceae bacterium]